MRKGELFMTKRMLIDDTCAEETRVVIVNGNKVEDVEFESTTRKQIKGNIYLAKVMRVEPSLQAAFVDYGGNRHGFLAFGEIHPDYYNLSADELAEIDKEVDDIIEAKKQALKERELERERYRAEKAAREEERRRREAEEKAQTEAENLQNEQNSEIQSQTEELKPVSEENVNFNSNSTEETPNLQEEEPKSNSSVEEKGKVEEAHLETEIAEETINDRKHPRKKRILKKRARKALEAAKKEEIVVSDSNAEIVAAKEENSTNDENKEKLVVLSAEIENSDEIVSAEVETTPEDVNTEGETEKESNKSTTSQNLADEDVAAEEDDDEDDAETDFEIQRKLLRIRKMFHRSKIQDVIKEGQILLVQVVKEERGNKGAALTTYLSLAGRYCVLMPNRIKSGGVSRKITNIADRKRLKGIVKELPLNDEMSMIVRTAGEEKTKADIVRDYNYLIRSWNQIRLDALKNKAPALIHEEGNLIRRALRDMFTKDISEIIVDGEQAYKSAKEFVKILSPNNLKKIKENKKGELPLFQKFQVESQLDKLHDTNVQLESGGYLVINPTEALVSIDVNSGRATKEKDLEETALKTNLEAADEIAKQLRMRNLAGLVVVDFIDMEDPKNNQAVEKRMKEAMKKDRARIQIAKMSCFGLLEISRQRMHSSFFESNYQVCPHCHGKGIVRTIESGAMYILRCIEEEGIKNKSSRINLYLPSEFAVYLLNQKRKNISALEDKYNMEVIICADDAIKNIADYRIERVKILKPVKENIQISENEEIRDETSSPEINSKPEKKAKRGRRKKLDAPIEAEKETPETVLADEKPEEPEEPSSLEPQDEPEIPENVEEVPQGEKEYRYNNRRRDRRNRFDRRGRNRGRRKHDNNNEHPNFSEHKKEKSEAVILYNSHEDIAPQVQNDIKEENTPKEKETWWRKLIKS